MDNNLLLRKSIVKPRLKHNETGTFLAVTSSPFVIGRALSCDYVIASEVISRKHCVLDYRDDKWLIKDFSRNGIYVNGILVSKEHFLKDLDVITLAPEGNNYTILLDYSSESNVPSTSTSVVVNTVNEETTTQPQINLHEDVADLLNSDSELEAALSALSSSIPPSPVQSSKESTQSSTKNPNPEPSTSVVRKSPSLEDVSERKKQKISDDAHVEVPSTNALVPVETFVTEVEIAKVASTTNDECEKVKTKDTIKSQDHFEEMEDELQCSICSEMFVKATTLNCSHSFCKYCIETWRKTRNLCPICRAKIVYLNGSIVLDNVIEKVILSSCEEVRDRRKSLLSDRQKLEEAKVSTSNNDNGRGRGTNRGRRGNNRGNNYGNRRGNNNGNRGRNNNGNNAPRIVLGSIPDITIPFPPVNQPTVISSESEESSTSTESESTTDSDGWTEDYDTDQWESGIPGAYYGGYGHCYSCGRRGHWANGCPFT